MTRYSLVLVAVVSRVDVYGVCHRKTHFRPYGIDRACLQSLQAVTYSGADKKEVKMGLPEMEMVPQVAWASVSISAPSWVYLCG